MTSLMLNDVAKTAMTQVLNYFSHNTLRRPMVFGPYLATALLTCDNTPYRVMSVLCDGMGQNDHVPEDWRQLNYRQVVSICGMDCYGKAATDVDLATIRRATNAIRHMGFYAVPELTDTLVRLYHCKEALTPLQLAHAQASSVAQASYSRDALTMSDGFLNSLREPKTLTFMPRVAARGDHFTYLREEALELAKILEMEFKENPSTPNLIRTARRA